MSVRQSELIVNLRNVEYNIKALQEKLTNDSELMPVIKANSYGLGVEEIIKVIEKMKINKVAVAIVDEGIYLRKLGYKGMIFILNQPFVEEIKSIVEYDLTPGVSTIVFIEEFGKYLNKQHNVHIEVGTGMGRTGIHPDRIEEFIKKVKEYKHINIEGMYTHFSCSDCDEEYTRQQIASFEYAIKKARNNLDNIKYIHACNSAGIVNFPEAHYTLTRPGLMMYGYYPDECLVEKIKLKPSVILKSKVAYIKQVKKNTSIGYGRTYITDKSSIIATIPLGYADGVRRLLSNNGYVLIKKKLAPIIGRVCMDSLMVDITEIKDIQIGENVYIWDNEKITVDDIAKRCNTINYEMISTISNRVPRRYIK